MTQCVRSTHPYLLESRCLRALITGDDDQVWKTWILVRMMQFKVWGSGGLSKHDWLWRDLYHNHANAQKMKRRQEISNNGRWITHQQSCPLSLAKHVVEEKSIVKCSYFVNVIKRLMKMKQNETVEGGGKVDKLPSSSTKLTIFFLIKGMLGCLFGLLKSSELGENQEQSAHSARDWENKQKRQGGKKDKREERL